MSSSSQKGDDEKTMRKIRILVSDPDGTDSSSDEEQEKRPGRSKRLFHEIFIDKVEAAAALEQTVMHKDIDSQLHSFSGVIHPYRTQHATVSMDGSPIKKYVGVHRRTRYGKYIAQINDPIMRKNVYLGTFNTAEEAHKAFITRKVDNEKKLASIKGFRCVVSKESEPLLHTEQLDSQLDSFAGAIHPSRTQHATVSMDGSPIKKYVGVHRTRYGKYIAQITDPIMRKKVYLGTFNTAEEAHKAFITRKVDNEKKLASIKGFQCVVSKESEPLLHTEQLDSQLDSFSGAIHASGTTQHTTVGMGGSPLKKYVGVYRRRSGKYSSEIKDPIKKKRVWLGTFNTAEEAHKAYITKKVEIQKKRASRKGFQWVVSKKSEPLPDVDGLNPCRGGSETSYFNEGKMIGEEDVLMQNNGGSNTEQVLAMASLYETSTMCGAGKVTNIGKDGIENNAYSASDESVEDGVGSNGGSGMEEISPIVNGQEGTYGVKFSGTHKSPSSVLEFESSNWSNGGSETSKFNAETLQNMEDSVKGLFLQDLNGALPIIDNHGFLLGKWSWIDDLSICGIEETRHV